MFESPSTSTGTENGVTQILTSEIVKNSSSKESKAELIKKKQEEKGSGGSKGSGSR